LSQEKHVIQLRRVRLSFPQIWEATQINGEGKPAFSASGLLTPDHPQIDDLNDLIDQVAEEKWEKKYKPILAQLRGSDKVCLHNGDLKSQYDGYAGNFYVSARSAGRPLIIGRNKEILNQADGKPYGGCYVNMSIQVWAQDNKFGKRINASLRGLQFVADGDAFSGGAPATDDEFDDLGDSGDLDV
jgi:hypothetical protein